MSISDREGDIYNIYEEASKIFAPKEAKAHYLIRAKNDRKICTEEGKKTANRIKSTLKIEKPLGQLILEVSETKKRKARTAHLTIYSKKVHIGLPDKHRKGLGYKPVEITSQGSV